MVKSYALLESALTLCLFMALLWFGRTQKQDNVPPKPSVEALPNSWAGVEVASPYDWAILGHVISLQHTVTKVCVAHIPRPTSVFSFARLKNEVLVPRLFARPNYKTPRKK